MAATSQRLRIALLAGAVLAAAAPASAQTMNANSASYNAGYNRSSDQENRAVSPSMRDANGNLLVVNGVIGGMSQFFAGGGASTSASGAFASGATAVGNSLSVVTQGNDNIVIIDSTQINNGTVTATSSTSGGGNGS